MPKKSPGRSRLAATRRGAKLVVALLTLTAGAAGYFYYHYYGGPKHVFLRADEPFAARLAEPASFIYGSSIHVWAYQGADGVAEVAVTGHADGPTCRDMTGLVFNAYLEKHDEPSDLFVAGAARLGSGHQGDSTNPKYQEYLQTLRLVRFDDGILRLVKTSATEGAEDRSAVEAAEQVLERDKARLKGMEADPQIAPYVAAAQSTAALNTFIRAATQTASDSGLVQVHTLPAGLAVETRQRIETAAKGNTTTVLRFDDLLRKWNAPEAALLVDVLRAGSGEPLSVRIPLSDLSSDGFEEAKRLNRSEVESSMVGDAERRRQFYQSRRKDVEEEMEACQKSTPRELEEIIVLNQRCSPDGFCYEVADGDRMTRRDYCQKRLPINMRIVKDWIGGVETLLQSINQDKTKGGDSRIDAMTHATLVDSMLRNWTLPVARSQEAFDYWREKRRPAVWRQLDAALERLGVNRDAINGEHLVFSVRVSGQELTVRPVHILDLARAIVVVDRKAGITRVVDGWGGRTQNAGAVVDDLAAEARKLAGEGLAAGGAGDIPRGRDLLLRALTTEPAEAVRAIEQGWSKLFRDDSALRAELAPKAKAVAVGQERIAAINELLTAPDTKEDNDREFLRRLSRALDADPGLPVDLHMRLATQIAVDVSDFSKYLAEHGEAGGASARWQVIDAAMNGRLSAPPAGDNLQALRKLDPDLYRRFRALRLGSAEVLRESAAAFEKIYQMDAEKTIQKAMSIVQQRAPEYFAAAAQNHDMPKDPSPEMQALSHGGELGLAEWDAAEMDGVQDQMTRRSQAEAAADLLWSRNALDLAAVQAKLAKAARKETGATTPAFQSASERLASFVKSGHKPDTLARVEIAQTIEAGARELLLRSRQRLEDRKTQFASFLSTHPRLAARVEFEDHRYELALQTLFAASTPISLYDPRIGWKAAADSSERLDSLRASAAGDHVSVTGRRGDHTVEVIDIAGLSAEAARSLAAAVERNWSASDFGRAYEQVLATRVPLRQEAENVRQLLSDRAVRLSLLKAMVFQEISPAEDLVPPARSARAASAAKGRLISYDVPTLEEVARKAGTQHVAAEK